MKISRAEAEDVLAVREAVNRYLATYTPPPGIELIEFRDETLLLRERVNLLLRNGAFGFALEFLFLVLMLDLKLAVWVSAGIATAFMGGFMLFGAAGVTISMISLFGLIIVLGLVVDDAIVIGENIDAERARGAHGPDAAIGGARGVLSPVFVGVLTTIAAFAPLLVTGGTFGDITRAIPLVVICVLLISMLEAFCILPRTWPAPAPGRAACCAASSGRIAPALRASATALSNPACAWARVFRMPRSASPSLSSFFA